MKIINTINNALLADKAEVASSIFARLKGLLGRKEIKSGEALVIKSCNSVHTFFMRFSIDVLFVDKNNRVVKAVSDLIPFRLSPVIFKADFVIEFPAGTIQTASIKEGDTISIQ